MAYTGGGVYRDTTDPVTGVRTVQTSGIAFFTVDEGIFSGAASGFSLGGKVVNSAPYLMLGWNSDNWLFMERAIFRFSDSPKTYTIAMQNPTRRVGSTARVYENESIRADSGQAKAFLTEIIRRSKLPTESKLYVRAEGQDYYTNALGTVSSGPNSFGAFFEEYSK